MTVYDGDIQELRKQYADTLKEIVKLESKIMRLKRDAAALENQMAVMDGGRYALDKDGCLYWDKLIAK